MFLFSLLFDLYFCFSIFIITLSGHFLLSLMHRGLKTVVAELADGHVKNETHFPDYFLLNPR